MRNTTRLLSGALGATLACVLLLNTAPPSIAATLYVGTGHYYDVVTFGALADESWTASKTAAENSGGYMTTITSAGEQAFLENLITSNGSWWAGGSDAAVENVWRWETGPETGTQFWQGKGGGGTTLPNHYAKWQPGEPNSSGEDYLSWNRNNGPVFGWNDVGHTNAAMQGYLIEFNTDPSVPEPSTLVLAWFGLLSWISVGWRRRRQRCR